MLLSKIVLINNMQSAPIFFAALICMSLTIISFIRIGRLVFFLIFKMWFTEPLKRKGWVNTDIPEECEFSISNAILSIFTLFASSIVPFDGDENFNSVINGTCMQFRKFFLRSIV